MSNFQGIIFDLDGVLADTAVLHFRAWRRLAADLGFTLDESINDRLKGVDRNASLAIILASGGITVPQERMAELARRKNAYYQEDIAALRPGQALPGAKDVLQRCRKLGLRTGLASASKNAGEVCRRLGLSEYLDAIVDASSLTYGKPHPEIFLKAATILSLNPQCCVGVEDSAAGIAAIKRAGMYAVGLGNIELAAAGADDVVSDIRYLMVDKLCKGVIETVSPREIQDL